MSADERRDDKAVKKIDAAIAAGHIRLRRTLLNEPYVYCDHPDYPRGEWRLEDRRFWGWMTHFIRQETGVLLNLPELPPIIRDLSGQSLACPVAEVDDDLMQLLETEPVAAVIYEFMQASPRNPYEAKAEPLWKELDKFAKDRRLEALGRRRFPRGPNILIRRLNANGQELKKVLERLGVRVGWRRSNGCIVTLERLDDAALPSFPPSSACNDSPREDLHQKPGAADRIARLDAKKRRP